MPHLVFSHSVAGDLARTARHLREPESIHADSRSTEILSALDVLQGNPRIGRPADRGRRELVIGREGHGFLALHRYSADVDTVFVLAIRSQREADYLRD